ncbi:putative growth-arrest-specific protein 8 [Neospora caninum Liverpool]|uniref:Growth-arrest-specific protein 8, putative n=1 Tax=Neospora caninum (strain Liverpool) TaxID=572307 RepID=F0VQ20_NEOCL|nr:putative growth-arrest-specific protein 8 [Neospora caninum Liverpool]CBZ55817.1 putative growth-arrest-specific protein 8 [Neospora caninum Liverpool]CEL70559.1 TPA: growth-arrest-specific protein 8, putative [Neospora caninum Liverpool]|eukprot:XP_003885843.1 putative growth-arrest-specific protein 8 [Neospora caninum Liverpool]
MSTRKPPPGKGPGGVKPDLEKAGETEEDLSRISLESLQAEVEQAREQLAKCKADRLYVQLEKDIISRFRDACRNKSSDLDRKLLLHDARVENIVRQHRAEILAYEQKIDSLEHAHKLVKTDIQTKGEDAVLEEDFVDDTVVNVHHKTLSKLESAAAKQLKAQEQEISNLENAFEQHLTKLGERFQRSFEELRNKYEQQFEEARQTLELREKVEVHEVEERKNLHINELMASHRSAFEQIKAELQFPMPSNAAYYNDITHDNLQLIKELRKDITEMKARAKITYKQMQETQQENVQLREPLRQQQQLKVKLEQQLRFYVKDKMALQNIRARDTQLEEKVKAAKQHNHQVEQQKHKLERDIGEYTRRLRNLQSDTNLRTQAKVMLYEQKVKKMLTSLEEKFRERQRLVTTLKLSPEAAMHIEELLRRSFCEKNDEIETLRAELQRIAKSYNDTVLAMKSRLKQLGVNSDALDFELVQDTEFISTVPAPYLTTTVPVAKGNPILEI